MVRYCSVYKCLESTKTNKNRRFFCFPADEQRCKQWIKSIGRMDLQSKSVHTLNKSYFVCELHFAASDCYKKFLKRFAVPTLFLPQLEDLSGTSKYTQTDVKLCCSCKSQILAGDPNDSQPQSTKTTIIGSKCIHLKRKWQLELKSESKKQRLLDSITKNVTNARELHMSPLLKEIIDAQKVLNHNTQGNRYDLDYLMYALNLYFASPVDYQFISKILGLPNIRTLKKIIAFGINTKFDGSIIKCLQSKSRNLNESERYCVICANEMLLKRHLYYQIDKDKVVGFHEINEKQEKEIATRVFAVMAHGIFSNWKQPLGFCFLSESKNYEEPWLENIIAKMIKIGYNVCAFVSNFIDGNQGSNIINMAKNKSVSPDQPFFFVNGRKIYYIFNVPHLTMSLRNNLINYDFVYHDDDGSKQVASWVDIEKMYNIEKDKNFKMAFKVTESHIRPNDSEKKCVKYATQVLSRTVAVTICSLVESGKLHEKSIGTTKFIELINDTFDILNSFTVSNDYKFKKAFSHAEYQLNTLEKAQRILSGLRVINRNNGEDVTNNEIYKRFFDKY